MIEDLERPLRQLDAPGLVVGPGNQHLTGVSVGRSAEQVSLHRFIGVV